MKAILLILLVVWLVYRLALRNRGTYRYDGSNPARRNCVKCGQEQHSFCESMETWDRDWWETSGPIQNPQCNCHKDVI